MTVALPGEVYFDPAFVFHDGQVGEKLFVVLCDSPLDPNAVVVARTTSVNKGEYVVGVESSGEMEGCHSGAFVPNYFLPAPQNKFTKNTWLLFDDIYEYGDEEFRQLGWKVTLELDLALTISVMSCASQSSHVPGWAQKQLIKQLEKMK